jgi:hypothetical protein
VRSLRLDPGSHASPRDGVCVVELSSVIAGEGFTDRPRCVCDVIGAFLRSWNDRSSHAERQLLRPYAKRIVGSRARRSVTRRRRDVCLTWAGADLTGNWASRAMGRLRMRLVILALYGPRPALRLSEGAGELAARVVFARYGIEAGLRVIDALLQVGSEPVPPPVAGPDDDAVDPHDEMMREIVKRAVRTPASAVPVFRNGANGNGANGNGANGNGTAKRDRDAAGA